NILRPRLEALGARVSMVRQQEAPVTTSKPDDFRNLAREGLLKEANLPQPKEDYNGLAGEQKFFTVQWQAGKNFYRYSEIRARAKKVNEDFKPDLVICMHFNAEEWGDPEKPTFVPRNHFHLLINGCYSPEEVRTDDTRFEMLERIFQKIDAEEIKVGEA